MTPGGVLALDLSSSVGWAYGSATDDAPLFGVWHLPKDGGEGGRYAAFENELISFHDLAEPAYCILEAPLSFQALLGVSTMKVMQQQYGLRAFAFAESWRRSVPCSEVSSDIVRDAVLGQSRFKKGKVKAEVMAYCRERGWQVPDDNAADACMVWTWYTDRTNGTRPAAGPLFRARGPARREKPRATQ